MATSKKAASKTNLSAQEVDALKIGRKFLPQAIKNLVLLCNHPNPSQQRQAIELLLRHTMADRNLQMQADGTIGPANGAIGGDLNITINKIDMRLLEIMENLPPQLMVKWATLMDEIEQHALSTDLEIFEGTVLSDDIKTCACGCGTPVKSKWVRGHQFKAHVATDKIKENRKGNPLHKHQAKKQLEQLGLSPADDS